MQMQVSGLVGWISLAVWVLPVCSGAQPLALITVDAEGIERVDTPVSAPLAGLTGEMKPDSLRLEEVKGDARIGVPMQIETGAAPKLWWILSGTTPAGQNRTFELVKGSPVQAPGAKVTEDDKSLRIQVGAAQVLQYNHAVVPLPAEMNPGRGARELYDRSGFIYPLWSPKGNVVSEMHPPDHRHHFGIWMPWTHTEYGGKLVDFWNIQDGTGTVRFSKYISTSEGPVFGGFQVEQDHVALKTSSGEKTILKEIWDVRVYNVGGPEKGYWLWDFQSTQRNIAGQPLVQDEYRYGGFAYRGAKEWKGPNAGYLTSEGKTGANANGTRARWCDVYGDINNVSEGVTILSHPGNFRHPEPVRIVPPKEGDYSYFVYAPSVLGPWEMKPGEDHVFRYRLFVHEGKPDIERDEQVWKDYAHPPLVKVQVNRPADAQVLFDGKDFSQWQRESGGGVRWKLIDGAMQIVPKSGSIMTKQSYRDFILHVEFKTPNMPKAAGQARGNSGVYLQRRYEIQILDSYGLEPKNNDCGAIYQVKAPDVNACRKPEEWQTYDILFRAARFEKGKKIENARVTMLQNGVLIHDNVSIPDRTGAGIAEGPDPAPIVLQDHRNEVCFRNIWIKEVD
jgi:hypothetical protein